MAYQPGDRVKLLNVGNCSPEYINQTAVIVSYLGKSSTNKDKYHIQLDTRSYFEVWYDDKDMKLIKQSKLNMLNTVGAMFKRLVDADTQTLYKAAFINGDLELTEAGTKSLLGILFAANKAALVVEAQAIIDEETKKASD